MSFDVFLQEDGWRFGAGPKAFCPTLQRFDGSRWRNVRSFRDLPVRHIEIYRTGAPDDLCLAVARLPPSVAEMRPLALARSSSRSRAAKSGHVARSSAARRQG